MTTSAIRFRGTFIPVEDPALREFLKAVAMRLPDYLRDQAVTADWLVEACALWMDDHEGSAPGLRDLALDDVLTTAEHFAGLVDYLRWLERVEGPGHAYDAQTARRVIARVLTEWGVPHSPG
jgi:hypothetical protein